MNYDSNVIYDKNEINFDEIYNNLNFHKNDENNLDKNQEKIGNKLNEIYDHRNENLENMESYMSSESIKTKLLADQENIFCISEMERENYFYKNLYKNNDSCKNLDHFISNNLSSKSFFIKEPKILLNSEPFILDIKMNNYDSSNIYYDNPIANDGDLNINQNTKKLNSNKNHHQIYTIFKNDKNLKYFSSNRILDFSKNFNKTHLTSVDKIEINRNKIQTYNCFLNTYVINSKNSLSNKSVETIKQINSNCKIKDEKCNSFRNQNILYKDSYHKNNESLNDETKISVNIESTIRNSIEQPKSKFSKKENQNKIIMIVDDHKFIRSTLKSLINKVLKQKNILDFENLEGSDGADIIYHLVNDQSNNNKIKCLITDENMEYINGSFAIQIIRKLEKERKIRKVTIASITAFEDESSKDLILKAGADTILPKPCNDKLILSFLEENGIIN